MSLELHRRAEGLMALADVATWQKEPETASRHLLEAAQLEEAAFASIPLHRKRTLGIIAVSAVSLYREGGDDLEAERCAREMLAAYGDSLPEDARIELRTLLGDIARSRQAPDETPRP